jgi:hypothetical protein
MVTAPYFFNKLLATAAFYETFRECKALVTAPKLPFKTCANSMYYNCFHSCISLKTPPKYLPSKVVDQGSYYCMFYGCTSLESFPIVKGYTYISGTSNATYSCRYMFSSCPNLNGKVLKIGPINPSTNVTAFDLFLNIKYETTVPQLVVFVDTDFTTWSYLASNQTAIVGNLTSNAMLAV